MKNICVGTIFVNNGILREAVDSIGETEDM